MQTAELAAKTCWHHRALKELFVNIHACVVSPDWYLAMSASAN
jgi:hypothetical protein